MTVAMFWYLVRKHNYGIAWTAIVTGLFGGLGFSGATLIKLILINPDFQQHVYGRTIDSNYHSILEQTFGFIAGLGVALAMGLLSRWAPRQVDQPTIRRWAEPLVVFFVMIVITYVNIVKNLEAVWLKPDHLTVAPKLWGYSTYLWFNLAYLALAITVAWPLWSYYRGREISILPASRLGKGQLFFVVFLWWIIIGNLIRTVPFAEQRLITEGVIHVNACLCTLLALLLPGSNRFVGAIVRAERPAYGPLFQKTILAGVLGTVLVVVGEFVITSALWGDKPAGYASLHIRFGPNATLDKK